MGKTLKGVVLGAAIGAGAAAVQAYREDQPVDQLAKNAALWGAGGAVVGGLLGSVGCRRCGAARGAGKPAELAREQFERGADLTKRQRKAARKQVGRAVELSRRQRKAGAKAAHEQYERAVKMSRRQRKAAKRAAEAAHEQYERAVKAGRRQRKAAHEQFERAVKMSRRQRKAATRSAVKAVHAARGQVDQAARATRHGAERVADELTSRISA